MNYEYRKNNKTIIELTFRDISTDKYSKLMYNRYFLNYKPNPLFKNLKFEYYLDHDGFDSDGPQSNLCYVYVTWEENNITYVEGWYSEHWYGDSDEKKNYFLNESKRPVQIK